MGCLYAIHIPWPVACWRVAAFLGTSAFLATRALPRDSIGDPGAGVSTSSENSLPTLGVNSNSGIFATREAGLAIENVLFASEELFFLG